MVKKTSTRRVMVGDPEHVVDLKSAKVLLANRMKFTPASLSSRAVTHGILENKVTGTLSDSETRASQFGHDIGDVDGFGATADKLADKVINRLSNDGQFNKFTLESVAAMTPSFLETVAKPENNDALRNVLSKQPASNGKIYTTYQLLRTEKGSMPAKKYADAADYALKDARYARSWAKGDFKLTVPRGNDVRDQAARASLAEFSNIEPEMQDFVAKLYGDTGNSHLLDQRLDHVYDQTLKQQLGDNLSEDLPVTPVIKGRGPHGTSSAYDFEEHEQVTSAKSQETHDLTGKPVIQGNGPHGTSPDYDFEEHDLSVGLDDLSDQVISDGQEK